MSAVTTNDLNSLYTTMLRTLGRDTVVRFRQTLSASSLGQWTTK